MKEIPLSKGKVAIVDDDMYDYLMQWKWHYGTAYALRHIYLGKRKQSNRFMHHEILQPPEGMYVDHIDRNKLNNTRDNLRTCTRTQNQANKCKRKDNTSGMKGVSWHKESRKWRATMTVDRKHVNVGYFRSKEDAYNAYIKKSKELYGEFAYQGTEAE